ncbi:MAG: S1 RNA-binding domain-containing protein [Chloroflexaceae bacterium]|nr:S1 RNA-binding domain-containing protein [Chloroflexaceae bacterium]
MVADSAPEIVSDVNIDEPLGAVAVPEDDPLQPATGLIDEEWTGEQHTVAPVAEETESAAAGEVTSAAAVHETDTVVDETPVTPIETAAVEIAADVPTDEVGAPEAVIAAESQSATTDQNDAVQTAAREADPAEAVGASFTPVEEEPRRPRRFKDLQEGMELEGKVTSIAKYGAFVDMGVGRDGLIHISEMSAERISSPNDVVSIGDVVQVRIKSIDIENRRISLTMRPEQASAPEPPRQQRRRFELDREALANLNPGDIIEGTITGLAPFGAFVDIGVGKDGLAHISELAEGRIGRPEEVVQIGDTYSFKLIEADPDGTRISLSLRQAMRKAIRSQKMHELEKDQQLKGTVSGLAPFGAFVDIGVGRDGLVHISQLSDKRVTRVEDEVKVGDEVEVRVLEIDSESKRISLTMRSPESPDLDSEPMPSETAPTNESAIRETELVRPAPPPMRATPPSHEHESPRPEGNRERGRERSREGGRDSREGNRDSREGNRGDSREGNRRRNKGGRPPRATEQPRTTEPIFYTTASDEDEEEVIEGNVTLEDLVTKFGGHKGRDRRRRQQEQEEDDEDRSLKQRQRQRDAIRRTLRTQDNDD